VQEYAKKLKIRLILMCCALLGTCAALIVSSHLATAGNFSLDYPKDFIAGFQTGIATGLFGILIFFAVRYALALKNEKRLKKLYIAETDERKALIMQKSGSICLNVSMFGLMLAAAIAGNFDSRVFFSLVGAGLFVSLVRGALKLFYNKKY